MNTTTVLLSGGGNSGGIIGMIAVYVLIFGVFWFFAIRPQRNKQKEHETILNSLEVGDSILTTSGFYGVVIDIMDEVVIVEFGSNKNCRIPMKKENIVEIEKEEED